jgi:hypothetical protein
MFVALPTSSSVIATTITSVTCFRGRPATIESAPKLISAMPSLPSTQGSSSQGSSSLLPSRATDSALSKAKAKASVVRLTTQRHSNSIAFRTASAFGLLG